MKIRIDCLIWHGCEYGKRQLTKLQRRFSDGCKNPYRCAECGSKDILCRAWLDGNRGVALGSDAFFPFSDNIERAYKSGVKYIAQPGGSVRDDAVIECCDKYGMAMVFTGIRLFHH